MFTPKIRKNNYIVFFTPKKGKMIICVINLLPWKKWSLLTRLWNIANLNSYIFRAMHFLAITPYTQCPSLLHHYNHTLIFYIKKYTQFDMVLFHDFGSVVLRLSLLNWTCFCCWLNLFLSCFIPFIYIDGDKMMMMVMIMFFVFLSMCCAKIAGSND